MVIEGRHDKGLKIVNGTEKINKDLLFLRKLD